MSLYENSCSQIYKRQYSDARTTSFQRSLHVTPEFVRRIGLQTELKGHSGCVNCLEWNATGTLLASGSDDKHVAIWDPLSGTQKAHIRTIHDGNIFSVKFLPSSNDNLVVSGAADCHIHVHDVSTLETTQTFSCHAGRVKRLATAPNVPFMFWSASEDGTIMQFDLRCPEKSPNNCPRNVLINLNAYLGPSAEAKCLSVNPLRPELLAVGANDPYVRIYDRRMLTCKGIKFPTERSSRRPWDVVYLEPEPLEGEDYDMPPGCAKYYIAGHLPQKKEEYKKKCRTLAATYLTFSPDGSELLVNLGGEQIYLFDVNQMGKTPKFHLQTCCKNVFESVLTTGSNGLHQPNGTTNGVTNGVTKHIVMKQTENCVPPQSKHKVSPASATTVDMLHQRANADFQKQDYSKAILLYNRALALAPNSEVLYSNRAAAYMKRSWDGDVYAALRDCYSAIQIDPQHVKAHFRLAKCLFELSWKTEALECLNVFKRKFPDYINSQACGHLDRDIKASIYGNTENQEENPNSQDKNRSNRQKEFDIPPTEDQWRDDAVDYEKRFCGHCNTTTDIKEANFFGSSGQYIVAGSDDGSFFIWDKHTTNIVRVLRGDDSIVNCLQPHPNYCMLATSGIDPVVRLWTPRPEDGQKNEREVDNSNAAAAANQKRMNADPLEAMLLSMGYNTIAGVFDNRDEEYREGHEGSMCRTS